jgi:glucose uptake protein GlcU
MLLKWQSNLLTLLGSVALVLVVANGVLFTQNRTNQVAFNQRQQFVQQTVPLENLYREIVMSLADLAVKANDHEVLNMLSSQGINVTVNSTNLPADTPVGKASK